MLYSRYVESSLLRACSWTVKYTIRSSWLFSVIRTYTDQAQLQSLNRSNRFAQMTHWWPWLKDWQQTEFIATCMTMLAKLTRNKGLETETKQHIRYISANDYHIKTWKWESSKISRFPRIVRANIPKRSKIIIYLVYLYDANVAALRNIDVFKCQFYCSRIINVVFTRTIYRGKLSRFTPRYVFHEAFIYKHKVYFVRR